MQRLLREHVRRETVHEVVLVVRGGVGEVCDLRLEERVATPGLELLGPDLGALVLQERLTDLAREVEARVLRAATLQEVDDAQDLVVVAEAVVLGHELLQRGLAAVSEGRVPDVVGEGDGLAEGLVEPEGGADRARDLAHLEAVGEAGALVVAAAVHEDLRLVHQATERGAVGEPVAVALEAGAEVGVVLRVGAAEGVRALHRPGGELAGLALFARGAVQESGGLAHQHQRA